MHLKDIVRSAVDSNFYPHEINRKGTVSFAIGFPYPRSDGKWLLRLFDLSCSSTRLFGDWDNDAMSGWAIEKIVVNGILGFGGDEVGIEMVLHGQTVGKVAEILVENLPFLSGTENLDQHFSRRDLTWQILER